jgi:DNA polymerase III delta subunit
MGGRRTVRMDDIDAIVSASREIPVWDLAEAVGNRDLVGALRVVRRLLFQGEQPVGLVMGLEKRIGDLIMLHEAMDKGWLRVTSSGHYISASWQAAPEIDEALSVLGRDDPRKMNSYRCAKLASQARKFTLAELCRWRALVVRTHEQLVTTSVSDPLLLETLLVRLVGLTGSRTANRPVRY